MEQDYEVVYERNETYREVFVVKSSSMSEASAKAFEMNEEHDWTKNFVIHGNESEISVRIAPRKKD